MNRKTVFALSLLTAAACAPAAEPLPKWDASRLLKQKNQEHTADDGTFSAANQLPSRYCTVSLKLDQPYQPNLVLEFEYRNLFAADSKPDYTGVNLFDRQNRSTFSSFPASAAWRKAEIPFAKLRLVQKGTLQPGDQLTRISIYSRISNSNPPAKVQLEIRNFRIAVNPDYNELDGVRVSYSALPLFDWAKAPEAKSYRLEYAPSLTFPAAQTVAVETAHNFFAPASALTPGLWHYRVTALPAGQMLLQSKIYIPERRHEWPLPEFNFAAFAAQPHPRLLPLALAEQEGKRDALTQQAEKLLDFQLPPNPLPYQEGADPNIRAWIEWYGKVANGVISSTGSKMQILGKAAMLTNRQDFKAKARDLTLAVSRTWDPESGSHMKRGDLQAAHLLRGLGFCYDASYDLLTPSERAELAKTIHIRGKQFYDSSNPFRSNEAQNHPWDRAEAAAFAACAVAEAEDSAEWFNFIARLYAYRFLPSLGFDGENNEGLAYWSYGLGLAVRFLDLARATVGANFFTHRWIQSTARFPLYCAPQEGYEISFADNGKPNHEPRGPRNRAFVRKLAIATADPVALWYAGTPQEGELTAVPPLQQHSAIYPHIGVAAFNTFVPDARENVAVGFHAGKFFAGHQHADQNSFVINAYGDKLAIDGGYYDWYGSKHFLGYSTQTVAHNTILVNGKGQPFCMEGADGKLVNAFDSADFAYALGDASNPKLYDKQLKRFERQLLFVKPDLVVSFDQLEALKPATYRWMLHSHTRKSEDTTARGAAFSIVRPEARLDGAMLLPKSAEMKQEKSWTIPPVQGYSVDLQPDPQPEWTLFTENAQPAATQEFLAAMQISPTREKLDAFRYRTQENAAGWLLEAVNSEGRILVLFNRKPGAAVTLDGITTNGAAAAIRFDHQGKVLDAMLAAGTMLDWQGKNLLRQAQSGNVALHPVHRLTPGESRAVKLNGKVLPLPQYQQTSPLGKSVYLVTGKITIPAEGKLLLQGAADGAPVHYLLANANNRFAGTLKTSGETAQAMPEAGDYLLSLTSSKPITSLNLTTATGKIVSARMLPENYRLPTGALLIEAETPTRQNQPTATSIDRESASGGKASADWNESGKFAEWEFQLPAAGKYRLLVRTATIYHRILRDLTIDGKAAAPEIGGVRWDSTGGFGYSAKEWRWIETPGVFQLAAGSHVLKCQILSGNANLDCFALIAQP